MEGEACFFKDVYKCGEGKLIRSKRLQSVSSASLVRGDELSVRLADLSDDASITCHKNCISRYVSPSNLASVKKREYVPGSVSDNKTKRLRSSGGGVIFDFREHCLFCYDVTPCSVEQTRKTPLKYRRAASLVRTDKLANGQEYKQKLLDICNERGDKLGNVVRDRILGAGLSDLHALDARYHQNCCKRFHNIPRSSNDSSSSSNNTPDQQALLDTLEAIGDDKRKIWTSTEVEALYSDNGGSEHSRRTLVTKVSEHFGNKIIALQSPGIATLLVFREHAPNFMKLVDDETEDDLQVCLQKVAKHVVKESKDKKDNLTTYNKHIDKETASACISETLLELLTMISPKFADQSLQSLMIGSIIASVVTNQPTPLQIAIGVLMSDHKGIIKALSKYNVTCSYDETRRFRRSAAVQAARGNLLAGMSDCSLGGLVQIIIDNFDTEISSQNCRLQCHYMAMLATQYEAHKNHPDGKDPNSTIPRLTKQEMKHPIECETPITMYKGPKKVNMPLTATDRLEMTEENIASQAVSMARARNIDFSFLKDILFKDGTPEYNGYNTQICRDTDMRPAPKSVVSYLPLLNMKPTDRTTVLTSITKGFEVTRDSNQDILVITADAAIYKIIVDISFYQPDLLGNMVALLGGMHLLMDFVACIGTLTADCGLKEILSTTFGSVDKMLSGKKFPQNVRALRLLVEEILRSILEIGTITSMEDLEEELKKRSSQSRTTKMWVEVVIRPVLIIMLYCRASHESDWLLHLKATEMMLPYMFAAHKYNYSRYGLYYVRSMTRIQPDILAKFCRGEQSLHHTAGLWNGEWSDMFIETTWMRKGHGPGGIIGNTETPQTMATWVYSMDAVMTLTGDLKRMGNHDDDKMKEKHKEEFPSRIKHDGDDRRAIRQALASFVDPLDPESHGGGLLLNIVSGKVANPEVNVDNSVNLGMTMMTQFETSWPEGFHTTISKRVITFEEKKKRLKVAGHDVMDPEAIYNRVIGLLVSQRDLDLQGVFATELTAYPPSMFNPDGTMRIATGKSTLKKNLQVEISQRNTLTPTAIVVDVSALLWTLVWPVQGTVETFITTFKIWLSERLTESDVYLCFDRYHDYSIKSSTRNSRGMTARVYKLTPQTTLPSRDAVLKNYMNKAQLNKLLCQQILNDDTFLKAVTDTHVLTVTGEESIPTQVYKGRRSLRMDLASKFEEADSIIAQQVVAIGTNPDACVLALADDTDVFVLLLFFYGNSSLQSTIYMKSPVYGRCCIDIKATYIKHRAIVPDLLGIHAISGCDSVAATYGIGKVTALTVASKAYRLDLLGDVVAQVTQVIEQAKEFMVACYGVKKCSSMTECRQHVWAQKTGKTSSAPKLCSLPPTTEAFHENILRAHLQVATWRAALSGEPPAMDPVHFGWEIDHVNKCLIPRNISQGTAYAPENVLKLVRCGCDSEKACRGGKCGCMSRQLPCTIFCSCGAVSRVCHNPFNLEDDGDMEEDC